VAPHGREVREVTVVAEHGVEVGRVEGAVREADADLSGSWLRNGYVVELEHVGGFAEGVVAEGAHIGGR
jgi:hypothetical protein